jgi:ParB/RepB/Spo0J family partition protein
MKHEIELIKVARLVPSPTNPRKHFAPGPLEELAANIARIGVQTPLHVRPHSELGQYEIIAGERRWRAVNLARERELGFLEHLLEVVPCRVVTWSDEEVVEFQLIENLQREDLSPLEEADGYAALQERGLTVEQIAERIGRDQSHVWRALKWARLPELARKAFEAGVMTREVATLIARIPDAFQRVRATLELVFFPDDLFEVGASEDDQVIFEQAVADAQALLADEPDTLEPMTVKAARAHVARHYMQSLRGVEWSLDCADLLPVQTKDGERLAGGACTDCPHRAGANPAYAGELASAAKGIGGRLSGIDADTCTMPACLAAKRAAFWSRARAEAAKGGRPVLDQEEAGRIFDADGKLRYGAPYVALDDRPGLELGDEEVRKKTWRKLLAKVEGLPVVVALDAQGRPRELVARDVAVLAVNRKAEEAGKESPFSDAEKPADRPDAEAMREAKEKKALEEKIAKRAQVVVLREIAAKVQQDGLGIEQLTGVVKELLAGANREQLQLIGAALEVKVEGKDQPEMLAALGEHLWAVERGRDELLALWVLCLATEYFWDGLAARPLLHFADLLQVSVTEAKLQARDELKAKKRARAKVEPAPEVVTEIVNAGVAVAGILEEGDVQREAMPSRALEDPKVTADILSKPPKKKTIGQQMAEIERGGIMAQELCDIQGTEVLPVERVIDCKTVEQWVDELLHAPLPCSPINEHGVLTEPVEIRLPLLKADGKRAKGKWVTAEMAWAGGDKYACGYEWEMPTANCETCSGPAGMPLYVTRAHAATVAVMQLREAFRKREQDSMAGVLNTALILLEKAGDFDGKGVAA